MSRILVVYYSRTGTTKTVAEALAAALGADIEEIVDPWERTGFLGYLRSGLEGIEGKPADIEAPRKDPDAYDLVVVGTPVWSWSLSAPVRGYLERVGKISKDVAFFLTLGGAGARRVFRQMEEVCGKAPLGVLALTDWEVGTGKHTEKIAPFAEALAKRLPTVVAAA